MGTGLKKIILEDGKGNYSIARVTRNKKSIKPSKKRLNKINPRDLEEIGTPSTLRVQSPPKGQNYSPIAKPYRGHEEFFARRCLTNFIDSSNSIRQEENADYLLLKNVQSEDKFHNWQISAEVHYLKKKD